MHPQALTGTFKARVRCIAPLALNLQRRVQRNATGTLKSNKHFGRAKKVTEIPAETELKDESAVKHRENKRGILKGWRT